MDGVAVDDLFLDMPGLDLPYLDLGPIELLGAPVTCAPASALTWSTLPIAGDVKIPDATPSAKGGSRRRSKQAAAGMKRSRTWAHTLVAGDGSVPTHTSAKQRAVQPAQNESMAVPQLQTRQGSQATQLQQLQHGQHPPLEQQERPRTLVHSTSHGDLLPPPSIPQAEAPIPRERLDAMIDGNIQLAQELRVARTRAEKLGLFPSRDPFDWFGMAAGLHHLPYGLMAADRHGGLADRTFSLPTQGSEAGCFWPVPAVPNIQRDTQDLLHCPSSDLLSKPDWARPPFPALPMQAPKGTRY